MVEMSFFVLIWAHGDSIDVSQMRELLGIVALQMGIFTCPFLFRKEAQDQACLV